MKANLSTLPKKILIASDFYLPGFKGGGPTLSLANLVDRLGDEFSFDIVTRDRDFGDPVPYPESHDKIGHMNGKARVFYLAPAERSLRRLCEILRKSDPDILYLNSFFSRQFTGKFLLLRWIGATRRIPLVVACRGEFSPGALAQKPVRKTLYIAVARLLGIYRDVVWQASSPLEEQDIRRVFGVGAKVVVAPDLTGPVIRDRKRMPHPEKQAGTLSVMFLAKISPTKNLHGALKILSEMDGDIQFDIYGPVKDATYWHKCSRLISDLPRNIRVKHHGAVAHDRVGQLFIDHDLLLLPTEGENFGHVIAEALSAGCPVLISDRTPWLGLADAGAGWDLPLKNIGAWRVALAQCVAMGPEDYRGFRRNALQFVSRVYHEEDVVAANRVLFQAIPWTERGRLEESPAG
ncbi:glycosyltransferase family 4 protein [Bauldia litoralis]|uniref:Glycosyltransferase involved in cell wall bisynthesis n=1 Tax=Bauldia litoralis TaxID=665467 RepID=A0A1G6CVA7_9HYPH|nr:glycosyltransferase family 4 protein [Bauldia litoralis]SDB36774.1 Glycosyltransferase involved in cell wall bisynthesis [Bauldia litoralis]